MSEKLTEEELVEKIMHWYSECNSQKIRANVVYDVLKEKQALNQIIGIVGLFYNFTPTAENINALPESIRSFIHDIETNADPTGMVRENVLLKDENEELRLKLQQKPRVSREHALAKLIDTLRWKFGHCEKTVSVNISWNEYHEIKDFVEVVE